MADHEEELEEVEPIEYIGSLLQTEDGETIPDVLKMLCQHLENQNKVLVKILTAMKKEPSA
jgi:ribosomal 50S subunit-associated protein YjgA (DUF615 family)